MLKFALIGDGSVAKYHRRAIEHVGGDLVWIVDPKYGSNTTYNGIVCSDNLSKMMGVKNFIDYYVIASPSNYHRSQIQYLLSNLNSTWKEFQIICEKPAFLPWEPIIDDSRLNIVLQLRYLPNLPDKAEKVVAHFVRDEAYFKSWKGDPKNTGGLFTNLFIHYIDLAIKLGADFEGSVSHTGKQKRMILGDFKYEEIEYIGKVDDPRRKTLEAQNKTYQTPIGKMRNGCIDLYDESGIIDGEYKFELDLLNIDNQDCYNLFYEDILSGGGIKPKDVFYLSWVLQRNSELFGYGKAGIGKTIKIGKELL